MSNAILPGDPPIALTLRRSAAAKRITLRVSQLDGRVTLTLPRRVTQNEALSFAKGKESWLRKHLDTRQEDVPVVPGAMIPVGGKLMSVQKGQGRRVVLSQGALLVPGPEHQIGRRLMAHLKEVARDQLTQASDDYAARLGKPYARITIRDTRSRWGSCTSDGGLMYSWRLVMCPPDVLHYVAAHEVAHLAEMNHSPAFWATVERLFGPYQQARAWLRKNGAGLHRYRF